MYVFGFDIPLNILLGIAVVVNLVELILLFIILSRLDRRKKK